MKAPQFFFGFKKEFNDLNIKKQIACKGKQSFDTFSKANIVHKKIKGKSKIYKCKYCRLYHIGSSL